MANTTTVLQHSAEEIDNKLNLIDENKNLLPYPYSYGKDVVLEKLSDVGDGSFLTTAIKTVGSQPQEIFLNTCLLASGKTYIISVRATNILEKDVEESNFKLKIQAQYSSGEIVDLEGSEDGWLTITNHVLLTTEEETTLLVYLSIPGSFAAEWLIKPQVEVQPLDGDGRPLTTEPTAWVPNMDRIGTYVDRRFNNTNEKFKSIVSKIEALNGLTAEDIQKMLNFLACFEFER